LAVDGQRQLVVVSTTFVLADGSQNTKPPMQQSPETLTERHGRLSETKLSYQNEKSTDGRYYQVSQGQH
jgi:hypothetical protein